MIDEEQIKTSFGKEIFQKYFGIFIEPEPQEEEEPGNVDNESFFETDSKPTVEEILDEFPETVSTIIPESSFNPLEETKHYIKGDNTYLEILDYFHASRVGQKKITPLLKEDANALLATIAVTNGLSTIVEGKSRSGKSLLVDKLCEILPSYYPLDSCTNKTIVNISDDINSSGVIYVSEFQEALQDNPTLKEAFKHISENKDWHYNRNGDRTVLSGNNTIISTGADENKKTRNRDVEVSGRFILLRTRDDQDKTAGICEYQDKVAAGEIGEAYFSDERVEKLKTHITDIVSDESTQFENPFAVFFGENYLPKTQKSIHYRTMYTSLINAFTKFDSPNRVRKSDSTLLTNISDLYLANELYHDIYCSTLKRLAAQSFSSLERSLSDVELEEEKTRFESEIKLVEEKKDVEWQEVWDNAYRIMEKNNPGLLNEWISLQSKDGRVTVYDPVKKMDVQLCNVVPQDNVDSAFGEENDTIQKTA